MAETTTAEYTVRFARPDDCGTILQLIRELAIYENALDEVLATEETLRGSLAFPDASAPDGFTAGFARTLLVAPAADPADVAGMALFFYNYSTWTSRPGVYLEDLFVRPAFRGKGFGVALIKALARETLRVDGRRLEWSVLKWNEPSIRFYVGETIGAKRMDEWVGCRVDGDGLAKLAA